MKRTKFTLIPILLAALIVAVLFYNKSKMAAKSRSDMLKAIPVSVAVAGKMSPTEVHTLTGTITANNDVAIVAESEGRVTAVLAKVGDRVSASAGHQVDTGLFQDQHGSLA